MVDGKMFDQKSDRLQSPFVNRQRLSGLSYCLLLVKSLLQKTDTDKLNATTATGCAHK